MGRQLHIDAGSGLAGDMLLAALIDIDEQAMRKALEKVLASLDIELPELSTKAVDRGGLRGRLMVFGENDHADQKHEEKHSHEHSHDHAHNHGHKHSHGDEDTSGHNHHHHDGEARHLSDMLELTEKSSLSGDYKKLAEKAFRLLAKAEGKVHGKDPEKVHFHEVSGLDTIIDVIGTCALLEELGITSVTCGTVTVGSGFVECAHGRLPLPAPATAEILYGIPIRQEDTGCEMTTPTGAALAVALADSFAPLPEMKVERIGYGAGTRNLPGRANLVRAFLGAKTSTGSDTDTVMQLTCVLDDITGEHMGYLLDQLREIPVLEAYTSAVNMKKNRPGMELTVLVAPADLDRATGIIFTETTALGLRVQAVTRQVLDRQWHTVNLDGEDVRVKVGLRNGKVLNLAAEYDDAVRVAMNNNMPLREVMSSAEEAARLEQEIENQ